jgi:hypothetical protein
VTGLAFATPRPSGDQLTEGRQRPADPPAFFLSAEGGDGAEVLVGAQSTSRARRRGSEWRPRQLAGQHANAVLHTDGGRKGKTTPLDELLCRCGRPIPSPEARTAANSSQCLSTPMGLERGSCEWHSEGVDAALEQQGMMLATACCRARWRSHLVRVKSSRRPIPQRVGLECR